MKVVHAAGVVGGVDLAKRVSGGTAERGAAILTDDLGESAVAARTCQGVIFVAIPLIFAGVAKHDLPAVGAAEVSAAAGAQSSHAERSASQLVTQPIGSEGTKEAGNDVGS